MTKFQEKCLGLLKEFTRVCEENNLSYFLAEGTMLGAVRHHGFIPWDDDIDVMMPREDYEKLLKLKNPFSNDKYFLQTYKSDPHYILNYAKLRDSSTTFIENNYKLHRINHGIWIDIFPLDGFDKTQKETLDKYAYRPRSAWFNMILCWPYACLRKFRKKSFLKDFFINIFALIFFFLNVGHYRNKIIDRRAKRLSFDECEVVGMVFDNYVHKCAFPKSYLNEYIYMDFENIKVRVSKDYDKLLTYIYGDYMTPPPENKRVGLHHSKNIDLNIGYDQYMKNHRL